MNDVNEEVEVVRCIVCRSEFEQDQLKGLKACPTCETTSIPMSTKQDVELKINWHELHLLCVWAENWARAMKKSGDPDGFKVLYSIIKELQDQYPDMQALTLSGELKQLQAQGIKLETGFDIEEGAPIPKPRDPEKMH